LHHIGQRDELSNFSLPFNKKHFKKRTKSVRALVLRVLSHLTNKLGHCTSMAEAGGIRLKNQVAFANSKVTTRHKGNTLNRKDNRLADFFKNLF
jgi:hypothetical protein